MGGAKYKLFYFLMEPENIYGHYLMNFILSSFFVS